MFSQRKIIYFYYFIRVLKIKQNKKIKRKRYKINIKKYIICISKMK